jgi:hypothetical protein
MAKGREAISRKAIEKALEGDTTALRLCLERIYPPRKSRPVALKLPAIETADDVAKAHGTVIAAMAVARPANFRCWLAGDLDERANHFRYYTSFRHSAADFRCGG